MTRKLTTMEQRAKTTLHKLSPEGGDWEQTELVVNWSQAGHPSLYINRERCAHASGGGYCKLSAVLADVLRFLPGLTDEESRVVWSRSGAGVSSVIRALDNIGKYQLTHDHNGKNEDSFS